MNVRVLFFAALRELMRDQSELTFALPQHCQTVEQLLQFLEETAPQLAGRLASTRVAINEEFVEGSHPIRPDDTIALIPPVAGG
jgi:sulfur-carrier protein